jgi:hypothetical protein
MIKLMTIVSVLACLFASKVIAEETKLSGECVLVYKGRIYSQGPCKAIMNENEAVDISAKVPENGVSYSAIISEKKQSGVLIGADTFVLADGPLEVTTGSALYRWPNGYSVDFKSDAEN